MDIREIRRANLQKLMDAEYGIGVRGAQSRLAEKLGKPQNFISRCLGGPEKPGSKTIGEDFAREIETVFGLETYALDKPMRSEPKADGATGSRIQHRAQGVVPVPALITGPAVMRAIATAVSPAPRAGADLMVESEEDADYLEKAIVGVPIMARIRRVRTAMTAMEKDDAESIARKVTGCPKHASEILILLDSVLDAALYQAIDLEEIQAITTLVQKRRNEKVHGVNRGSKEKQNDPR